MDASLPPTMKLRQGNFPQACIKNSVHREGGGQPGGGDMLGRGACMAVGVCMVGVYVVWGHAWGTCMAKGGVCGGGCAWQGACMVGSCMVGGVHSRGACMAEGMEACMAGRGGGACMAGETAIAAGGTHPTGMHLYGLRFES